MSEAKKTRVTAAARAVFLRFGYKRTSMSDIAEAADVSRAALYLIFASKEDVFIAVYRQWLEATIAEIQEIMGSAAASEEKLQQAFEVWAVRPFEMVASFPEARDLVECSFEFAQTSLRQGYATFEAAILPALQQACHARGVHIDAERTAHVLGSAVRGFKLAARTPDELRQLIRELLQMTVGRMSATRP